MEGPRAVRKEELQDLTELINYVFRSSSGKEPDMHICFPIFISDKNLDNLLVMVDEESGKPVSHMGLWINEFSYFGQPMKVGSLGSVCTDPNFRGQGLATKLMEAVFNRLEAEGVDLLLVSGGRGLYQRAGCTEVGDVKWYALPQQPLNLDFEVVVDPDVSLMNELWIREPLHSKRGLKNFETLVDAKALARCINCQSTVYMARLGNSPLAYVQAITSADKTVYIYEWAGDRTSLVQLALYIANLPDVNSVQWPIPSWEKTLLALIEHSNASLAKTTELSGTYKIVRFAPFVDKVSNYLSELYGIDKIIGFDEGDTQVLQFGDEEIKLDHKSMHLMLLKGTLPDNLPPKMKELFSMALPLPLPWPIGFDYI